MRTKSCEVYCHHTKFVVAGLSYSTDRGWAFNGLLKALELDLDADEIGLEILETLASYSLSTHASPPDLRKALLAATHEKSWGSFQRAVRLLSVDATESEVVIRSLVRRGGGFAAFDDSPARTTRPVAREVGMAVKSLLAT